MKKENKHQNQTQLVITEWEFKTTLINMLRAPKDKVEKCVRKKLAM